MSWKKSGQLDLNMKQRNRSQPARSGDELGEKEDEKTVVVDVDGEAGELAPAVCALWLWSVLGPERPPHIFQCGCAARRPQARVDQAVEQASPVLALELPNQDLALACSPHKAPCSQLPGPWSGTFRRPLPSPQARQGPLSGSAYLGTYKVANACM